MESAQEMGHDRQPIGQDVGMTDGIEGTRHMPGRAVTEEEMARQPEMSSSDLVEKSKQLGKHAVEIGTKVYHTVESKIQELSDKEKTGDDDKKPIYAAGAVAIASTIGIAARKRQNRRHALSIPEPTNILDKARRIMPGR